jgi:hypothetical protein
MKSQLIVVYSFALMLASGCAATRERLVFHHDELCSKTQSVCLSGLTQFNQSTGEVLFNGQIKGQARKVKLFVYFAAGSNLKGNRSYQMRSTSLTPQGKQDENVRLLFVAENAIGLSDMVWKLDGIRYRDDPVEKPNSSWLRDHIIRSEKGTRVIEYGE